MGVFNKIRDMAGSLGRAIGAADARPALLVFGKHPGWDDHMDDLGSGVASERLLDLKRRLYTEGVSGAIDAGVWESLPDHHRLPGFDHGLIARPDPRTTGVGPGWTLVARLWASTDAKGRAKYPMVAAAECPTTEPWAAARASWPVLTALATRTPTETTAQGVAAVVNEAEDALDESWGAVLSDGAGRDGSPRAQSVFAAATGEALLGWRRVFYEAEQRFGGLTGEGRTAHVRTPRLEQPTDRELSAWLAVWIGLLTPGAPVLVATRVSATDPDDAWSDAVVGDAGRSDFDFLLTNLAGLPSAAAVPYELTESGPAWWDRASGGGTGRS